MTNTGERRADRGMALVVALLMMLIVTMLGTGLTIASRSGVQVGNSFAAQQLAFQAAVAGLEHARAQLRQQRFLAGISQATFTEDLERAAGDNGVLVASNTLFSFGNTNGILQAATVDDVPLRDPTDLFGASYQVFLTNDPVDGINSTTDTNNIITLTSFGSGPNGVGFAAVQGVYETIFSDIKVPNVPGAITLLGPNVHFEGPDSNQQVINGGSGETGADGFPICYPSIATTTNESRDLIRNSIPLNRHGSYRTCNPLNAMLPAHTGPPTVINYIDNNADPSINPYDSSPRGIELPLDGQEANRMPPELTVEYWNGVIAQLSSPEVASYVGDGSGTVNLGNPDHPRVVVIDGPFTLKASQCSTDSPCGGILLVQGDLEINGTPSYQGVIYAVGTGKVTRNGGGSGNLCGGLLVADIVDNGEDDDDWITRDGLVGRPSYTHDGGGNSSTGVCSFARQGGDTIWGLGLRRISFQQLRNS